MGVERVKAGGAWADGALRVTRARGGSGSGSLRGSDACVFEWKSSVLD
jgi:hypothetical protein